MRRGQYDGKPCWACLPCGGIVQIPLGGATTQHSPEKRAKTAKSEPVETVTIASVFSTEIVEQTFDLPYPIGTNHLFKSFVAGGKVRRAKSSEGIEFVKQARAIMEPIFSKPMSGYISIEFYYQSKGTTGFDIDNICKCALDAMSGVVYPDDRMIRRLLVERGPATPGGRLRVRVKQMSEGTLPAEEAA